MEPTDDTIFLLSSLSRRPAILLRADQVIE